MHDLSPGGGIIITFIILLLLCVTCVCVHTITWLAFSYQKMDMESFNMHSDLGTYWADEDMIVIDESTQVLEELKESLTLPWPGVKSLLLDLRSSASTNRSQTPLLIILIDVEEENF